MADQAEPRPNRRQPKPKPATGPTPRPKAAQRILSYDEMLARRPRPSQVEIDCYWQMLATLRSLGMVEPDGLNVIPPRQRSPEFSVPVKDAGAKA